MRGSGHLWRLAAAALRPLRLLLVCAAGLGAGCAGLAPAPEPAPVSQSVAVASLWQSAQSDAQAGRLANAAASLERALRLEPRNARLWHELARVRLRQGDYPQAENVAARSNSWAGADNRLRAENWRLIAEARAARGDTEGASAAYERGRALGSRL